MADQVTKIEVRMYRMGTGDCFGLRFRKGNSITFRMLIDAGTIYPGQHMIPYLEDLHDWLKGKIDLLVITHEHSDHVAGFNIGKSLFVDQFDIKKVWMAWTEDPNDSMAQQWKEDYGKKKQALRMAADQWNAFSQDDSLDHMYQHDFYKLQLKQVAQSFGVAMNELASLHFNLVDDQLEGMRVIKEEIIDQNVEYYEPGDVIQDIPGAEGIRFYVLGPPRDIDAIKKEDGDESEAYLHNKHLDPDDYLSMALLKWDEDRDDLHPFESIYVEGSDFAAGHPYIQDHNRWRQIDHDWLTSAGNLALRLNHGINNLSLVLAIEFEESGRVLLFPGDAEIGSWLSWQQIEWTEPSRDPTRSFTDDLLARTVFYKVAHHLSHNGTARADGLQKMTHPDLVAMASMSYGRIFSGWKRTMPNRQIVKELIQKTFGRLIVLDPDDAFYDLENQTPLRDKINEVRRRHPSRNQAFYRNYKGIDDHRGTTDDTLWLEYVVREQN